MQRRLLDLLICPRCLPGERPLRASIRITHGDEIVEATLACSHCAATYPVSAGLATYPTDAQTLDELLLEADRRLMRAKREGRNRVIGYGLESHVAEW